MRTLLLLCLFLNCISPLVYASLVGIPEVLAKLGLLAGGAGNNGLIGRRLGIRPLAMSQMEIKKGTVHQFSTLEMDSLIHHEGPLFPDVELMDPQRYHSYSELQVARLVRRTTEHMRQDSVLKTHYQSMLGMRGGLSKEELAKRQAKILAQDKERSEMEAQFQALSHDGEGEGNGNDEFRRRSRPWVPKCSDLFPGYDDNDMTLTCNQARRAVIRGTVMKHAIDDVHPNPNGSKCSLYSTDVTNATNVSPFRAPNGFKLQKIFTLYSWGEGHVNTWPPYNTTYRPATLIPTGFNVTGNNTIYTFFPAVQVDAVQGQHVGFCAPDGGLDGSGPWQCYFTNHFFFDTAVARCTGEYYSKVLSGEFKEPCYGNTPDCPIKRKMDKTADFAEEDIAGVILGYYDYAPFPAPLGPNGLNCKLAVAAGGTKIFRAFGNEEACLEVCVDITWVPIFYREQSYRDSNGKCFGMYA